MTPFSNNRDNRGTATVELARIADLGRAARRFQLFNALPDAAEIMHSLNLPDGPVVMDGQGRGNLLPARPGRIPFSLEGGPALDIDYTVEELDALYRAALTTPMAWEGLDSLHAFLADVVVMMCSSPQSLGPHDCIRVMNYAALLAILHCDHGQMLLLEGGIDWCAVRCEFDGDGYCTIDFQYGVPTSGTTGGTVH